MLQGISEEVKQQVHDQLAIMEQYNKDQEQGTNPIFRFIGDLDKEDCERIKKSFFESVHELVKEQSNLRILIATGNIKKIRNFLKKTKYYIISEEYLIQAIKNNDNVLFKTLFEYGKGVIISVDVFKEAIRAKNDEIVKYIMFKVNWDLPVIRGCVKIEKIYLIFIRGILN